MAKFISISGASSTGKSTLVESLRNCPELSNAVFLPDIFQTVWQDLVDKELFSEFDNLIRDQEFLIVFIQKVINYYNEMIEYYKDTDKLVILDSCWVDISVYSVLNMWFKQVIRDVQTGLLSHLSEYDDRLDRVYITKYDETKQVNHRYHIPFRRYNIKCDRPLELRYYHLCTHLKNSVALPSSEVDESVNFILEDLLNLGYL